ncbi:DNA-directed RNA polymerase subunit D [archaeon]|jgi:DNA-directed RNA polymerase subunit D|nr:DNA-directed RNA polymerase subunit D [archaeon]MDP6547834.1 DNA-directed RNA polymerase subunit D [Candidatus Woesearchaeota archaeon]MDP7263870.1 DNA-directed RNA polymerase subunit D [Candidatus Woesearchaeota archaeon]HJN56540.1 DNA-directed RNA polymerase subunit D [Candidatus Woesearchaeota archaeon]|tara:strand:+ start:28504 stop:29298 length:795 start_codon:yes stop_codon:yes gene_type:complete
MEVRVLENKKDEGKLSFVIKDTTAAFVNTLRRIMVEEVPTMAVEDVEFRKNSSALYDEMIAHRLGLTPLKTDLKSYNLPEKCKCEGKGCARCQLKLTLKASKGSGIIYASELHSKDPAVKPVCPKMPIAKLLKGQSLELEATAVLGKGKVHSKWSPCIAYYKHKPSIEIGNVKNPEEIMEATHGNVFEIKNGKLEVIKDNLFKYDLAGVAEEASNGEVKVKHDNDFIFHMESWGQLSCKEILNQAIAIFNETYDELNEEIKKAK